MSFNPVQPATAAGKLTDRRSSHARSVAKIAATLLILVVPLAALIFSAPASAVTPAPALSVYAVAGPTVFSPEAGPGIGSLYAVGDRYTLHVTNTGSEPTSGPIMISDALPAGLTVTSLTGVLDNYFLVPTVEEEEIFLSCEPSTGSCTYGAPGTPSEGRALLPGERLSVNVNVTVAPGTVGPVTNTVLVSGGGAPSASVNVQTPIGTAEEARDEPFGFAALTDEVTGVNGLTDTQAGSHPYETTLAFSLNTVESTREEGYVAAQGRGGQAEGTKDVIVDVPPGFVGDPDVVEKCPQYEAANETCPPSTQIGVARLEIILREGGSARGADPVFNVIPEKGYPAQFDIEIKGSHIQVPLYVSVTPDSNYGVRVTTPGISEFGEPVDVSVTFFGTPETDADPYDKYRTSVVGAPPEAFLDNPVDCSSVPQSATIWADSWHNPGPWLADGQPDLSDPRWASKSTTVFSSLEGCELLQFNPTLSVTPDTTRADEPAGTTVDIHIPQAPQRFPALITPEFKDTTVTLPAGLSLSPSAGDGLEGCTSAQIALSTAGPGTCPNGSQVGTLTVTSPLLSEPLQGKVFLGTPNCDPCSNADASDGNMFRLFLQIEGSGVTIKLEGHIYANTSTGQLTTTFLNTPALPASDVELHFNGGLRAGLATPQTCGTFTSTGDITPYSTPITPDATPSSTFPVDWNGSGEACPAVAPFHPSFSAGTSNPNAGQFSPFTLTFGREDREGDLADIQVHMPPGLSGILTGVPLCGEPQASLGTCSAASQIGKMTVAAGPGSHPFYEQGQIYLTGPYKGAPFGLSIVVPTLAGPFNLGNVVVRAEIYVNPVTTALTVTSDPFPQILDGIPLRLRTANVTIDRPGFMFNPTSCAQQQVSATLSSAEGTQSNVSAPFAVSGCAGLHFGPAFKASSSGKTSKAGGASLDVKLTYPTGPQSNIAYVKVELPKQLPSRLTTLQKACTAAQFDANPAGCPVASVIGIAKAISPLLPVALTGPVYFVSHGGEAFPNLEIVLEGYGVRVDLTGNTFISKKGITSTTFKTVPDAPVNSFELYLPEGKFSALAANGNLCKSKLLMPTDFTAQDGAQFKQDTKISITGCAKPKKAKAARASRARKSSHRNAKGGK